MKILLIVVFAIVTAFILFQVYMIWSQRNIETYPYKVVKSFDNVELRTYEARLFTSTTLAEGSYEKASNKGFSVLANYIFGGNETKEKIAMTSPVTVSMEDSMTMMFMVPKKWSKENLPSPNAADITFREEPQKTMAAIRFGGWANDEKIAKYKEMLTASLDAKDIPYTNRFYFFGYNPPVQLFNRRNEVVVELAPNALESLDE